MNEMVEAVIFDMDGLMFDTERMFKRQFRKALDQNGLAQVPDTVIEAMIGCDSRRIALFEDRFPGIGDVMRRCQEERADYFFRFFPTPGSANKKGLRRLMGYLDQKQIPYAIASSSFRHHIERFCDYAGFAMHPKAVLSGKDGYRSKPEPDIFLAAANALGADPANCLVLEDSKNGILAAHRAKMQSIFIPDQIVPDDEMRKVLWHTCADLSQVIEYLENTGSVL